MKQVRINAYESAEILEEFGRYAFARLTDNYNFKCFEILTFSLDANGEKQYKVSPGRPGLTEAFQGAAQTPVPEAEMRVKWEKVKADVRQAEERKIRASIEAKEKEKAAALRADKLREAHALAKNSREELKQIIQEGKAVDKLADNKRVATLLQRIAAAEFIIDTL